MNVTMLLCGALVLLAQPQEAPPTAEAPEVVRVLSIQARQIEGGTRHLDSSLESLRDLLEKVPGNDFREIGFHEIEVAYGDDGVADLGEGYSFHFRPVELTERGEIAYECHIDLGERTGSVEALRITGKAVRGQGAVFRGFALDEGEMMVIMSIAKADEEAGRGKSGGNGEDSGGTGTGNAGAAGKDGEGDGGQEKEQAKPEFVPELAARKPDAEPPNTEPSPPAEAAAGEKQNLIPPDKTTMEGILRALEEQDMAEQMTNRGRRFDVVVKGDWW